MSEEQRAPIVPDTAQLERLRPWLDHRGVSGEELAEGTVRFTHDPGGMCLEWRSQDGAQHEDFLTDSDSQEAKRLLGT